jgi:nickel-dependent lactate racemase
VTDLEDKDMQAIFIKPFHNLQEALNKAIKEKGKNSKVIFLIDGSITVPMIERR